MFFYTDDTLINLAGAFAEYHHRGQTRRGNSEPYFNHTARVAKSVQRIGCTADAIAAAYLHDVVEDTDVTLDDLLKAGFPQRTVALVDLLTRKEGQSYNEYINSLLLSNDREALLIKLSDLNDNSNIDYRYLWDGWRDAVERYAKTKVKIVDRLVVLRSSGESE